METSEQYMEIARRWFTDGWTGNLADAEADRVPAGKRPRRMTDQVILARRQMWDPSALAQAYLNFFTGS